MVYGIHGDQASNPLLRMIWYWKDKLDDLEHFFEAFRVNYVGEIY